MKSNSAGSIRQRADGSWEGRYYTAEGKRKSVYGKTKAIVKCLLKDAVSNKKATSNVSSSTNTSYTVEVWMNEWLHNWLPNISANASRRYELDIRLHIVPEVGSVKLCDLTTNHLQNLYNHMITIGLSAKSIKCTHSVIHSALDKAIALGYININPSNACVLPKLHINEMHPIKDTLIPEFLKKIKDSKYGDAYYIALFTGLREGELLGLTWDCIDFEKGTIYVYRQLQRTHNKGTYAFTYTKNGKSRIIVPAPSVIDKLKAIQEKQNAIKAKSNDGYYNSERFVFSTEKGSHLTINMLYKPFKAIVGEMGIGETRFHDLRHSYAVLSLQSGCDIKTLSGNLGHSTIALTLDRYGHISETMKRQSSELMEALIQHL